ncbi:MAG: hypothetical protein M3N18_06930 [Actinomycetota bacterium]|nr:hypothetical protein [Actinomycetota bacterium]
MRRIEKRLRALEERDNRFGYVVALQRLPDKDHEVLHAYLERWQAAGGELVPQPAPTPEEAEALAKLNRLRRQAIAEGWGNSSYRTV